ncbi:hypothetical protein B0H10DRAFT_492424 [Mycena sp. CBHHK59/15]|nr:hypothetical protein B0H10DRAFT_492424 [Mycena sp. CBHHK59/15]
MYLPDEDMDYDHRILLTPASSHQSSVTVMPSSVASSFKDYGTLRGRSSSRSSSSFSSTTSDGVLVLPPSHSPEPPTPLVVKRAPLPEVVDVVDSSSNAVPGEGGHPSSLQAHSTGYSPCYLPAHSILDLHPPASNTGSSGQSVVGSVAFFSNGPAFPNYSPYMPPAALDSPGLFGPRSPRDSYPKLPSRTPIVLDIDRASPGLFGPRSPPGTYPELPSTVLEPEPAHADDNRPLSFAQVDLIGSPGRPWSWVGSRTPIVIDERRSCSPSPAQPPVRCQRPPSVVAPCLPASRSRSRSWSPGIPCPSEVYDRSRSRTYSSRSISPVSHRSVSRGRTRSRTPPPIVVTAPTDHVLPRPRCGVSISPPRGSVRLRREYTPHYSPSPPRCISPPYYRHSPRSPRRGSRSRSRSRSYVARSWPRSRSPSRIVGVPAQPVLVTDSRVSSKSSVHSISPGHCSTLGSSACTISSVRREPESQPQPQPDPS